MRARTRELSAGGERSALLGVWLRVLAGATWRGPGGGGGGGALEAERELSGLCGGARSPRAAGGESQYNTPKLQLNRIEETVGQTLIHGRKLLADNNQREYSHNA